MEKDMARTRKPKSQTMEEASDTFPIDPISAKMRDLELSTERFGQTLSKVLAQGIARGRNFEDILKSIGQKFVEMSLRTAFKPIEGLFGGLFNNVLKTFTGGLTEGGGLSGLFGGLFGGGASVAASGGMAPTLNGGAPAGPSITMNISTPDADSFRRSEAQVSAALARAVARGQRNL
jgi:phage-related minor tail protein